MKSSIGGAVTALGVIAGALALAACGERGERPFLSIGTAGTGGVYYPLGGAIASRLSLADPSRSYTAEVSGGSVENVNRIAAGQMDLGIVMAVTAYEAERGTGDYDRPVPGLRAVAPLYPNLTHILVADDSPIASVADFRGRRVSVGTAGSGTEQMSRHVLAAYGLAYEDIRPRYLSFAESAAALGDGAIDAAIFSVGYPASAVLEAATTTGIRLLEMEPDVLERMLSEHPYYSRAEIPGGLYPGVDAPVVTVGVMNWIVGMETLPDDVVTTLLNVFRDDRVALEQIHEMARQIDLSLLENPPIPLHPAAAAWLAER
jgi:TRAP transporter TAXI family solute receptor